MINLISFWYNTIIIYFLNIKFSSVQYTIYYLLVQLLFEEQTKSIF